MSNESKLTYAKARQIYLETSNYPLTITKFQEFGLSEENAKELASLISTTVSEYEKALATYQRDLGYGVVLSIIGLAVWIFLPERTGPYSLHRFRYLIFAGIVMLYSWYSKRKVIKIFESDNA